MTMVKSATESASDPGKGAVSGVSKTGSARSGDTMTVDCVECSGGGKSNVNVVFRVNASSAPSATAEGGNLKITGSGSGNNYYVTTELSTTDVGNWTVTVNTSGNSQYTFKKGAGGGGHG
ncbi:MAG: hypothetical protein KDB96_09835 [Flavobacteriales bacterium]|nr:hypothetical protein [Flavobacteriales bacterium]MCB0787407.1 hypothetical protein [Flavobacteriales bacterium]MCB0809566.1 hypothetical protein [Flavobacteriales bacterium]